MLLSFKRQVVDIEEKLLLQHKLSFQSIKKLAFPVNFLVYINLLSDRKIAFCSYYHKNIRGLAMKKEFWAVVVLMSCCLIISGCSFSTSSKHSSKSSSSPSRSSSGGGDENAAKISNSLDEEVEALAILYVGSSGSAYDFQRELSQIASGHGVVDWEGHAPIYSAIGKGVKRAGVSQKSLATLPFLQGMTTSPFYSKIVDAYK